MEDNSKPEEQQPTVIRMEIDFRELFKDVFTILMLSPLWATACGLAIKLFNWSSGGVLW